jgi:hypothetical protein
MTEQEWFAGTDATPLLVFLKGKTSERKLRLFACACCRRIWSWLKDERSKHGVEVAEEYADGFANPQALQKAHGSACAAAKEMVEPYYHTCSLDPEDDDLGFDPEISYAQYAIREDCFGASAACAAVDASAPGLSRQRTAAAHYASWQAQDQVAWGLGAPRSSDGGAQLHAAKRAERAAQAALVRDIFGNPFGPVSINPSWLTPAVKALARAIYEERTFTDLPVLADALEEGGCTNDAVLSHLRGPGPHCRGCWPVDLILNKS